jgi:CrcB protein
VTQFLWICLGGALGTGARVLVSSGAMRLFGTSFPYGTLAVNLLGSFLLAVILTLGTRPDLLSPTLRQALTTGVMGGFTTYSTFNQETLESFEHGALALGLANVAATLLGCLLAGFAGLLTGRALLGSQR